jgi:hypothetical protein
MAGNFHPDLFQPLEKQSIGSDRESIVFIYETDYIASAAVLRPAVDSG